MPPPYPKIGKERFPWMTELGVMKTLPEDEVWSRLEEAPGPSSSVSVVCEEQEDESLKLVGVSQEIGNADISAAFLVFFTNDDSKYLIPLLIKGEPESDVPLYLQSYSWLSEREKLGIQALLLFDRAGNATKIPWGAIELRMR